MKNRRLRAFSACALIILNIVLSSLLLCFSAQAQDFSLFFGHDYDTDGLECSSCEVSAENEGLLFSAGVEYPPYPSAMLPYTLDSDNFAFSCSFKYNYAVSSACSFSAAFDMSGGGKLLFSLAKNGDAELAELSDEGEWTVLFTVSLSSYKGTGKISPSKFSGTELNDGAEFEMKIIFKDGYVFVYIDSVMLGETTLGKTVERLGFAGHGCDILIKSISVGYSLPEIKSVSQSYNVSVKKNDGVSPLLMSYDTGEINSESLQSAVFDIKSGDGVLYVYSDEKSIDTLSSRLSLYGDTVLPSFYVSDTQSASRFSDFADENNIHDCYVISSSENCIKKAVGTSKYRRGVLDLSSSSSISVEECTDRLYSSSIHTVILSEKCADFDTVYALHRRLINVFVKLSDSSKSYYGTFASCCDGIITQNANQLVTFAEQLCENELNSAPAVVPVVSNVEEFTKYSSFGAVCVEVTLDGGKLYCLNRTLSEIYSEIMDTDCVLYLTYGGTDKSTCDLLNDFNEENESRTRVFLLTTPSLAQYAYSLPSLFAHVKATALSLSQSGNTVFEIETILRSVNSALVTEEEISDELLFACKSRCINVCTYNNNGGFAVFTTEPEKYADSVICLEVAVSGESGEVGVFGKTYGGKDIDLTSVSHFHSLSETLTCSGAKVTGSGSFAVSLDYGSKGYVAEATVSSSSATTTDIGTENSGGLDRTTILSIVVVSAVVLVTAGSLIAAFALRKKKK